MDSSPANTKLSLHSESAKSTTGSVEGKKDGRTEGLEGKRSSSGQPWTYYLCSMAPRGRQKGEPKDSRAMFSHRVKWEKQVMKQNELD